jgi:hypothetical protein
MATAKKQAATWKVRSLCSDYEWEGILVAHWEVALDPISDEYTPKEINARKLFSIWAKEVKKKYPNGLIPIHWGIECREQGKAAYAPFQFNHFKEFKPPEDFLSQFTWPVDSSTGEKLNWLRLPVVDKLWNLKRADKGGFIQEATGWKPAILQPYVYLPALTSALNE